jgi:hypothetical protein
MASDASRPGPMVWALVGVVLSTAALAVALAVLPDPTPESVALQLAAREVGSLPLHRDLGLTTPMDVARSRADVWKLMSLLESQPCGAGQAKELRYVAANRAASISFWGSSKVDGILCDSEALAGTWAGELSTLGVVDGMYRFTLDVRRSDAVEAP